MNANFTNCSRGEYSRAPADTVSGAARQRVVYASWHPDQLMLAVNWVSAFKERIEVYQANALLTSRVFDKPREAGTLRAEGRQAIETALGDVTDFVVVATASYFGVQRRQGESELGWMIESSSAGAGHVIWVAAVEPKLRFEGLRAGDCDLSVFSGWHPTRSGSDPLEPYSYFDPENLKQKMQFAGELNDAVTRLLKHCPVCPICGQSTRP